jgi:tyrosine-protein kinase Etk/Wzc
MSNDNKDIVAPEPNLIETLIFRFMPFWPLFAILCVFTLAAGWAYLHFMAVPEYEVTASVLIKDEKKGVNDARMLESMDAFSTSKIVDNEIKVIRSRSLINAVVDTLALYAPIYEDRKVQPALAYASSPIQIRALHPDRIQEVPEAPQVYFSYNAAKRKVKIGSKLYPLDNWVKTPFGTLKFSLNPNAEQVPTGLLYFSLIPPRQVIDELLAKLSIEPSNKLATVIDLYINDPVPQRGKDILNNLIFAYNRAAIVDRNLLAVNTMKFIEGRIREVEKELKDAEARVQQYKTTRGVVDLGEQGKLFLQNVGENDRKLSEINMQLAVLNNVENYVLSKNNRAGIVPSTLGVNEPVLAQLLQKLYESEIQYEKLKGTTAQNNPLLISISDEIEKIRPSILENIQNQRVNLQSNQASITQTIQQFNSELKSIPQKERELLEINRQQAIKSNAYSFLLQKREETALSYAPSAGSSRVVDLAEASIMPVSPNPLQIYFIAIFLALAGGIGYVTSKEMMSNKLLFRSDIEELTNLPITAELSEVKTTKDALFTAPSELYVIEQFRQMRATMGLFGRKYNKKKIMIASSMAGEGKSHVSSNLAYSLSASGKKVILLDFDLRNPNSSNRFGFFKQAGITDYLSQDIKPEELIQPTTFPNLSILPAGSETGDHTELLLNGRLESLFEYLDNNFDYVIIDTPPIELVTDAYLLAEYSDAVLFVVRHGFTPKSKLRRLSFDKQLKAIENLSIVFTSVKPRGFIKGDKGYGFGYGYGYESRYGESAYLNRVPANNSGASAQM